MAGRFQNAFVRRTCLLKTFVRNLVISAGTPPCDSLRRAPYGNAPISSGALRKNIASNRMNAPAIAPMPMNIVCQPKSCTRLPSSGDITPGPMPAAAQSMPVPSPSLRLNQVDTAAISGTMKMACTAPRRMPNDTNRCHGALMYATRIITAP